MRPAAAGLLVALVAVAISPARADDAAPAATSEPDVPACVRAYEQAQVLRREGKLRAARDQLIVCVKDPCPAVARQDCTTWLDQVEASLPSVALSVVDAKGVPVLDAAVSLDGVPVHDWASGRAIGVDPGRHEVRAMRRGGETAVVTVLVVEGRRNQPVVLELGSSKPAGPQAPPADAAQGSSSAAPWIFGGVAVLGLGSFAGFGIAAMARESHLDETCKPYCTDDQTGGVRTLRVVSGVGLGVGVVGVVGVALSLLLAGDAPPGAQATRRSVRVAPWLGGDASGLRARF